MSYTVDELKSIQKKKVNKILLLPYNFTLILGL